MFSTGIIVVTRIIIVLLCNYLSIYVIRSLFHLFYHQLGLPERTYGSVESPCEPPNNIGGGPSPLMSINVH